MKMKKSIGVISSLAAVVLALGMLAVAATRPTRVVDDLPPGFTRDAATGALSVSSPPGVAF